MLRDGALALIAVLSQLLTREEHRAENGFTWEPIREVAILFAGIFVAIAPVVAMLQAARPALLRFCCRPSPPTTAARTRRPISGSPGGLSAFLDNTPTYVVFFELAGGDPKQLMGPLAGTLASISMGAVYMGALTYIGNAPNLVVRSIAHERGIGMPNFFAYTLWAGLILVPLFALLTVLPVSPILNLR